MFFARDASNTHNKIAVMCDICKKTSKVSFSCFNVKIFFKKKHCEVLVSCSDREMWNFVEIHASLCNCMQALEPWITMGNLW